MEGQRERGCWEAKYFLARTIKKPLAFSRWVEWPFFSLKYKQFKVFFACEFIYSINILCVCGGGWYLLKLTTNLGAGNQK